MNKIIVLSLLAVLSLGISVFADEQAGGGLDAKDPMVKISTLPLGRDLQKVMSGISADVSRDTGIEQKFITYWWQDLKGVNWNGKKMAPKTAFVDLYVPGFFTNKQIKSLLTSIPKAIEKHAGIEKKWVFIQSHFPKQGQVYLSGEVQVWKDYKGPENQKEYETATSIAKSDDDKEFDAHEPHVRLHFQDPEMDFAFALILGATGNGGCEIGEAFEAVSKMKDGDAASWQQEWINIAERTAKRGEDALAEGHKLSAQKQFQRACYYYRAALISMSPKDARFTKVAGLSRDLLRRAGKLMDPPIEYFEIPFEGTKLPGFYRKADNTGKKRKTLLMIGGGETFAEDLVFYTASQAHEYGYNFLTVDLPGQGLLPCEGKCFRPDMYVPMKAVIDYVLTKPEVDADKLAAFGISGGGGFVPQTAEHDKRLKAIVVSSAVVDAHKLFADMPIATATQDVVATWSSYKQGATAAIAWRWGVPMNDLPALVKANVGFTFDPTKVTCPALIIIGEGEYQNEAVKQQQTECMAKLPNPKKKLVVTPANEGASNHCITENHSIVSQVVFDWLDEVFTGK